MRDAPTENGIAELDELCRQYNEGHINLSQLICTVWNKALYVGEQNGRQQARNITNLNNRQNQDTHNVAQGQKERDRGI